MAVDLVTVDEDNPLPIYAIGSITMLHHDLVAFDLPQHSVTYRAADIVVVHFVVLVPK